MDVCYSLFLKVLFIVNKLNLINLLWKHAISVLHFIAKIIFFYFKRSSSSKYLWSSFSWLTNAAYKNIFLISPSFVSSSDERQESYQSNCIHAFSPHILSHYVLLEILFTLFQMVTNPKEFSKKIMWNLHYRWNPQKWNIYGPYHSFSWHYPY